ncbi:MAG: bifunctional 3-demethylubiquinone-9 3-methyltransferase/ 2-octaprenyl-6-hydroxy phenol methylase [Methanocella sp. PtaU1.Bin125]|nr:MAG: bifunctional 3-demethylubiquinone-9 3-methyltransferase/ 2-octaprenyl-6-hydroxy phenol methylase [Methanocella sp. PtaU1.Bin125]
MKDEKRDFNKAAASWDTPVRVKLATDVAGAVTTSVRLAADMDVLDFGCGTGLLMLQLQPHVRSVTGVDSSEGMLEVLRTKVANAGLTNVRARHVDLDKGDALEGCYHLITSSMTLHHIREIQSLLNRFFSITAPAGHICIADLDPDDGHFHGGDDTGVFHNGFDRAALRRAFEEAGYVEVHDKTAARMTKPVQGGGTREFTIFLMTGQKPE